MNEMLSNKLTGNNKAKERREALGKALGIGYCNSSQFLTRLNNYGITKEEFYEALKKINKENEEKNNE